jgi:hypothetical protein
MLLDMLVAIAGQDYGGGRQCARVGFAPPCPGRRDPSPVTFSVVAGFFRAA